MECSDTGSLQRVRLEYLDVRTASKLNRLIGLLKRGFRGNARVTLTLSGGRVDEQIKIETSLDEEKFETDEKLKTNE